MKRDYLLPLLLIIISPLASMSQYCTSAGPSNTADSNIGSVALTGETTSISYTGCPGVAGVEDQTTQVADVIGGNSYSVDLVYGTCGGGPMEMLQKFGLILMETKILMQMSLLGHGLEHPSLLQ